MTASIVTFPHNPAGKMSKKDYVSHMKEVWKRMGMIKVASSVVVPQAKINAAQVEAAAKRIKAARSDAPVPIDTSPLVTERIRVKEVVTRSARANASERKPRELVIGAMPRRPHIRDVVRVVGEFYDQKPSDILSDSRRPEHVAPRHACYFIMHKVCGRSLPAVGIDFKRDHTTILSGVRRIDERLKSDTEFDEAFRVIVRAVLDAALTLTDVQHRYWGA